MARRKRTPRKPYRSNYEDDIARGLEEDGVPFKYEAYSYEYDEPIRKNRGRCGDCQSTNLMRTGWYTPDFFVRDNIIVEAKGRFTATDRRKIQAVLETVPELREKLVLMFMTDNKLNRNAKMRYSEWAEREGIDYTIGTKLKKEWLDG